jgi:hypothetical protein
MALPSVAKNSSTPAAINTDRIAIARRCAGDAPKVSDD